MSKLSNADMAALETRMRKHHALGPILVAIERDAAIADRKHTENLARRAANPADAAREDFVESFVMWLAAKFVERSRSDHANASTYIAGASNAGRIVRICRAWHVQDFGEVMTAHQTKELDLCAFGKALRLDLEALWQETLHSLPEKL